MPVTIEIRQPLPAEAAGAEDVYRRWLEQTAIAEPDLVAQARAELGETADPRNILCRALTLAAGEEVVDLRLTLPKPDAAR